MKHALLLMAFAAISALPALAQESARVKSVDLKIGGIDTPQFSASNVPDRRWRPKTWLELDVEFELDLPQSAGGRKGTLDSITVNYYVGFAATPSSEGKGLLVKGTFNYADIPAAEKVHGMAFMAPSTLRRMLMKDQFTPTSDIQAWGVEIMVDGKLAGGKSSTNSKWWESDRLMPVEGNLLPKKDTPFAILWGDYDLAVRK